MRVVPTGGDGRDSRNSGLALPDAAMTVTGASRRVAVPSPRNPSKFVPQHLIVLVARRAHEWPSPVAICGHADQRARAAGCGDDRHWSEASLARPVAQGLAVGPPST